MRETLAAALLRMAGWDRRLTLVDPMCGSGTLVIEAALWAGNIAPGLLRERFGFERWANFDDAAAAQLRLLRGTLRSATRETTARIIGADHDPAMIEAARKNARAAGVRPAFRTHDIVQHPPSGEAGLMVTNPPYGMRLEMAPAFPRQVAAMIGRLHGWRIGIMAGSPAYRQAVVTKPCQVVALKNGPLECEFLLYDMP